MKRRIVVLASGGGTNCEALLDACRTRDLEADVVAVVTNNAYAGVISRAERADVPAVIVRHGGRDAAQRAADDQALIEAIDPFEPDLVVLAGWMRILGDAVCARFPIINLHPAQPGMFAGTRAIERAFTAWQNEEIDRSGVMVHWVPDSAVDVGPLIVTEAVALEPGDTLEAFEERMHQAEHRLIVKGAGMALKALTV